MGLLLVPANDGFHAAFASAHEAVEAAVEDQRAFATAELGDVAVNFGNAIVGVVLRSPLHGLLSGATDLVRYTGRRSGLSRCTPTQYARNGDDVIILVGRSSTKTWWRNFEQERDLDVLVRRRWLPMTGRAIVGADDPRAVASLLDVYLARFPKAVRTLDGDTAEARARSAVVVWCRPR